MRFRTTLAILLAGGVVVACSATSDGRANDEAGAEAASSPTSCPAPVIRTEPPEGPCDGEARQCVYTQPSVCTRDISDAAYANEPGGWICACLASVWSCSQTSPGLGLVPCDAGSPEAPDASDAAASDARATADAP